MIYLASPFSHPSPKVRQARVEAVADYVRWHILERGIPVFSPVLYTAALPDAPIPFEPWAPFNDHMIELCSAFAVYQLPGWEESRGIAHESNLASRLGKEMTFIPYLTTSPFAR